VTFSRANAGGWAAGAEVTTAQINAIDQDHAKAIDGTGGGAYPLTSALTLAGQGVIWNFQGQSSGIYLPPNWMQFAEGTRAIVRSFAAAPVAQLVSATLAYSGIVTGQGNGVAFVRNIEVPHNATLNTLKLYFKINVGHGSLPSTGPAVALTSIVSGAPVALTLAATNPQYFAIPSSIATYENGGAVQSLTYTASQNNTAIRSAQRLMLSVVDEVGGGALAGNQFLGFDLTYTLPDFEVP